MELDVLAIGAHPDDVELGCGGTLALLANHGRRVGILHLTSGESGTRGTPEQRRSEAREAGLALGAVEVAFLDCGDGSLRRTEAEERTLIERIRLHRPQVVLGPPPHDRHPDHGRAHQLTTDACFYAGLAQRQRAQSQAVPHRPAALFAYMQHDLFTPSFIVDVTSTWPLKEAALAAYKSQLYQPDQVKDPLPPTKIASKDYSLAVEGRARHYGLLIGATYGEPFWSRNPLPVKDPWSLRLGGIL